MNKIKIIFWPVFIAVAALFSACDPNEELYEKLDADQVPYNKQGVTYTLIEADYDRFGDFIEDNNAFSNSFPSADYIPRILDVRFPTLRENSSVLVTYNHYLLHPDWWDAGFGYVLTDADYTSIGSVNYFSPQNPPSQLLFYLQRYYNDPVEGEEVNLIYNYMDEEMRLDLATYKFMDGEWVYQETITNIYYVGYELQDQDYEQLPQEIAAGNSFSEDYSPELYIPAVLRNVFSYAVEGDEKVVKYNYDTGSSTVERIDKYTYMENEWEKVSYIQQMTDQYIFGADGWAFDPTVRFEISRDDYFYLAQIDPIPHPVYNDFGYYYGASAYYMNFDVRLLSRRLTKNDAGEYEDPELGAIYDNQGAEAAMDEMLRRINEEGIIKLLQYKFPDAVPEVEGIEVHYFVSYQTFADNWVRAYPTSEYICTAAGTPPQFELVSTTESDE